MGIREGGGGGGRYAESTHLGNNKFWCNARLVTGPDYRGALLTLFLVLLPTALFYGTT